MPRERIEETFEEAKRIVEEERKKDPSLQERLYKKSYKEHPEKRSKAAKGFFSWMKNLIGFTGSTYSDKDKEKYYGPSYERRILWELDDYCQQLAKEKQLRFFRCGEFTESSSNEYSYGFSFLGSQKIDLSEARQLGTPVLESILKKINSSSEVHARRVMDWNAKKYWALNSDPDKDVPLSEVCMKIVFWDENNDRIMPPHIAQIAFLDEKMQYFTCDPKTQELKLIFEESYNDALKFKNDADLKK